MNILAWSAIALGALVAGHATATAQPSLEPAPAVDTAGAPAPMPMPMPPPNVTESEIVSTGSMQWEVLVDQQPACTTPCRLQLDGPRWVTVSVPSALL